MNHISEITKHPDFYKKPFLVLGTGPSLDNFVWEDHKDKNIIAIYSAVESCNEYFICFAPDKAYWVNDNSINFSKKKTGVYVVTRAFNNRIVYGEDCTYFEYDCDIAGYSDKHDGFFHGGDGKRYFPFHEPFPCSCTVKAIAHFLGKAGIKKVFTCGIDGGEGISKWVTPSERESYANKSNFDEEVKDFYDTCKQFNIEIEKI